MRRFECHGAGSVEKSDYKINNRDPNQMSDQQQQNFNSAYSVIARIRLRGEYLNFF
ncbi:hypothetical protein BGLA2_680009 [Burkholderia gladioli]|nr:hypothetical protein BGLA2_680009 [Burkholderia gladioli]